MEEPNTPTLIAAVKEVPSPEPFNLRPINELIGLLVENIHDSMHFKENIALHFEKSTQLINKEKIRKLSHRYHKLCMANL